MLLPLVNDYEEITHDELKPIADHWDLSVYTKVRVADVISLDHVGATGELKRFGLQSHFDFLVCRDRWQPIFAVEFDGRFHSTNIQKIRDSKKDELCRRANLPILRINSRYLNRRFGSMSLLAWIVDVHELERVFSEAQELGNIPADEPFDPFFFSSLENGTERFPYWFSAKPLIRLHKLYDAGKIADRGPTGFIGRDKAGVVRGVEYIRVTENDGILVRSAMRPQQFPVQLNDLFGEILLVQLEQEVQQWLAGEIQPVSLVHLNELVSKTRASLKISRSHS